MSSLEHTCDVEKIQFTLISPSTKPYFARHLSFKMSPVHPMKYPQRLRPSAPQVPALEPTVPDAYDDPQEFSSNKVVTSIFQ